MKKGVLNVVVSPWHKTSLLEAGVYDLQLEEGAKFVALAHCQYPDHDRSLVEGIVYPFLEQYKPDAVFLLGGMIHDDAFNNFAPRDDKRVTVHQQPLAPEIVAVLSKHLGTSTKDSKAADDGDELAYKFRDMVFNFGADHCGQFIDSFSQPASSQVFYIPSASPLLPNEAEIMNFLYYASKRVVGHLQKVRTWMDKHPDEAPPPAERPKVLEEGSMDDVPTRTQDFARLLGLVDHPRVQVLRFSSGIRVNDTDLFMVGDFRRRNSLTAGMTEFEQLHHNIWRSFDGKVADGWFTTLAQSLPTRRRQYQFHEIGNLMDSERMGYQRGYDRWGKSIVAGRVVRGQLHGCNIPIIRGANGRRGIVFDGIAYEENMAAGRGKQQTLGLVNAMKGTRKR
jgi:hypothetical protein